MMAKKFTPRTSKRQRKKVNPAAILGGGDVFRRSDEKLLEGALIEKVKLSEIQVREQVRTKFNDHSLRELAANIEMNGLIQPLVVHRDLHGGLALVCGERRYRAMTQINQMTVAPCFILEGKTGEELMAIQFSENSSREELHYVDRADGILNYQRATGQSERKICQALGISKSEVHRGLLIAKLSTKLKEAAKTFSIEKYVLLEVEATEKSSIREELEKQICSGHLVKRSQLRKFLLAQRSADRKDKLAQKKVPSLPRNLSANAFLKAMQSNSKHLDEKAQKALEELVESTKSGGPNSSSGS